MDLSTIVGLKEFDIDKEGFLTLIEEEAKRAVSEIVSSTPEELQRAQGMFSELKVILMKATSNRVSINNLGEFTGTDATDWN